MVKTSGLVSPKLYLLRKKHNGVSQNWKTRLKLMKWNWCSRCLIIGIDMQVIR